MQRIKRISAYTSVFNPRNIIVISSCYILYMIKIAFDVICNDKLVVLLFPSNSPIKLRPAVLPMAYPTSAPAKTSDAQ
jgi:hypothetical protein